MRRNRPPLPTLPDKSVSKRDLWDERLALKASALNADAGDNRGIAVGVYAHVLNLHGLKLQVA